MYALCDLCGPRGLRGGSARRSPPAAAPAWLALLSAISCLASASCAPVWRPPAARAAVLAVREERAEGAAAAFATYRVSVGRGPPLERYGIVLRISTDERSYWATEIGEVAVPAGGSLTGEVSFPYVGGEERYVAESATVESAWFE